MKKFIIGNTTTNAEVIANANEVTARELFEGNGISLGQSKVTCGGYTLSKAEHDVPLIEILDLVGKKDEEVIYMSAAVDTKNAQ